MGRACLFCGEGNLTIEDVWPKWLLGICPPRRITVTGLDKKPLSWAGPAAAIRARVVCQRCNNGWMSDLESAVCKFLKPLIEGASEPVFLSVTEQLQLGAWLTKTAMVIGPACRPSVELFPFEDCAYLRTKGTPPTSVVDLQVGSYSGADASTQIFTQAIGIVVPMSPQDFEVNFFSIRMGRFVGILMSRQNPPEGVPIVLRPHAGPVPGVAIRRPVRPGLEWPPVVPFDDGVNSLQSLADRVLDTFSPQTQR